MGKVNKNKGIVRSLLPIVIILISLSSYAQKNEGEWQTLTIDAIFEMARTKAFQEKRDEAREMLLFILNNKPDYFDASILYARTLAWDNRFTEAREMLLQVLVESAKNEDAIQALIDVDTWSGNFETALNECNQALTLFPLNSSLLLKKALVLNKLKRDEEALVILNDLLAKNPGNQEAATLLKSIQSNKLKYTAGLNYSIDWFNQYFDPAQNLSLQVARTSSWGTGLFRLNYANRFNESGIQPEIELYPRISNGIYGYLNYGYSTSILYPKHRSGAEIFFSIPKSFELSGGFRSLNFNANSNRSIITASASWYYRSNWFSLRSFIIPAEEIGTSYSATLTFRKYFGDNNSYLSLSAGAGYSPDERRIQNSSGLSTDQLFKLKSQRAGIQFQKSISNNWIVGVNVELINQELIFDLDEYVLITNTGILIRKRF